MRAKTVVPYSLSARVYDEIYAWKDYAAEARRIRDLIRENGRPGSRTLLDLACGTGTHLSYLSKWYDVTGLDQSPEMLRVARRKLPHVRFVRGSMERFNLADRFDVVTCLFSAIASLRTETELRRTTRNIGAHLNPGGVAIVEPWLTKDTYRAGSVHLRTFGSPERPIARMHLSQRRGNRSIMDMHHLAGTSTGVRHWVEHHDLGLYGVATYLSAFRSAGFRARFLKSGLMEGRGLYVAALPAPRA